MRNSFDDPDDFGMFDDDDDYQPPSSPPAITVVLEAAALALRLSFESNGMVVALARCIALTATGSCNDLQNRARFGSTVVRSEGEKLTCSAVVPSNLHSQVK